MNIFEITLHKVPQALLHSLLRMHDALCRDWCLMLLWYKWPTLAECAQCVEMMPLSMLRISLQVLQEIGWCLSRVVFCTAGAAASSGGAAVAPEAGGAIPGGGSADPALVWGPAGRAAPLLRAQSLHSWAAARCEQPQHSHDTFKLKPEAMLEIQRRGHTRYWLSWHLSQLQSEAVSDDCSGPMMVFMPGERVEPLTCLLYARCSAI